MTITQFQLALSYNSGIDFSNARVIFAGACVCLSVCVCVPSVSAECV